MEQTQMTQEQNQPEGGFVLIGANALYDKPVRYARFRIEPKRARAMHNMISSMYAHQEGKPLDGAVLKLTPRHLDVSDELRDMKTLVTLRNTHPISMTISVHDIDDTTVFESMPITREQIENGRDTGYLFAIDTDMIAEIGADWIVDEEFHNTVLHKGDAAEVYSFARDVGVTPMIESTMSGTGSTKYIQRMSDLSVQVMQSNPINPSKQAISEVSP